ncbi:hypothetical protein R1sor_023222 [Riccia sorocarpa]|uniref:Kinesin-like protein n=1 Tax=Riccia sorocarpa TaxID=122646 RepID=A0ABD3GNV0_9MARC
MECRLGLLSEMHAYMFPTVDEFVSLRDLAKRYLKKMGSAGSQLSARREMAAAFIEESTFIPKEKESNIKVYVRIRPLSKEELLAGDTSTVTVLRDGKTAQVVEEGAGYKLTTRTFKFDGCLGPTADQDQVMERLKVSKMLDSVLEGYSSTIMACGQTGSGKTYTMSGRDEGVHKRNSLGKMEPKEDGLIARSVAYLFDAMDKRNSKSDQEKLYTMRASYYEVYNEQVNDLLRLDAPPREVKWSSTDSFYVDNLLLVDCETVDDVFAVLDEGSKNRKVGSHEMNKDSSRSHCIMTLHVDSNLFIGEGAPITRYGRMLFVDLAGSERLKKSKSSGDMLRETGNINRSLFTLGKVISALSEGKRGDGMVPYRESLLTKLLMESLGGNSLALMIACVSPASSALDETLSTLHYGTCAKNIVNAPSVNMDARDKLVLELEMEIARLKKENAQLRSKLGLTNEEMPPPSSLPPARCASTKRSKSPRKTANELKTLGSTKPDSSLETQLKGLEKLFAKDGNFYQDSSYQSVSLPRTHRSVVEGFERQTNRSVPSLDTSGAFSDTTWSNSISADRGVRGERANSEETSINTTRISLNSHTNGLLGMYRGIGGSKSKGTQHLSRKNRISVDHLSSRTRKVPSTCKYGTRDEDDFQGSITVNENAFHRLLSLSTPAGDREDDFYR